jgi:hypothetical protein
VIVEATHRAASSAADRRANAAVQAKLSQAEAAKRAATEQTDPELASTGGASGSPRRTYLREGRNQDLYTRKWASSGSDVRRDDLQDRSTGSAKGDIETAVEILAGHKLQ